MRGAARAGAHHRSLLVDLDTVEKPVNIPERLRVRRHIARTIRILRRAVARSRSPLGIRERAAEIRVDDHMLVLEEIIHVAGSSNRGEDWFWPVGGVGSPGCQVGRNVAGFEVPDLDIVGGPFHCVNSSAVCVQLRSVPTCVGIDS